jgi:hypothetical protein
MIGEFAIRPPGPTSELRSILIPNSRLEVAYPSPPLCFHGSAAFAPCGLDTGTANGEAFEMQASLRLKQFESWNLG